MTTPPLPPGEHAVPDEPPGQPVPNVYPPTSERVAVILAIGISTALVIVTVALLWAAYIRLGIDPQSGLSENATQLLTGWGGGIISILAAYVGYTFGRHRRPPDD